MNIYHIYVYIYTVFECGEEDWTERGEVLGWEEMGEVMESRWTWDGIELMAEVCDDFTRNCTSITTYASMHPHTPHGVIIMAHVDHFY